MTAVPSDHAAGLRQHLGRAEPLLWLNPALAPAAEALAGQAVTWEEVRSASAAFEGWRPALRRLFPELTEAGVESALEPLPDAPAVLGHAPRGGVWLREHANLWGLVRLR